MQGSVAQLDRVSDFGSEGWGFESLQVYLYYVLFLYFYRQ